MKIWKSVASAVLVSVLLAGCGSNAGTESSEGGTAAGSTVSLKIFVAQPRLKEHYDKYIEQFKAKEKAEKNIEVNVQLEMPPADNAAQILKTRLASNDAPDVFALHAVNEIPPFSKAGYLEDLSGQPFVDKLLDSVKPSVTDSSGKVVAVPLETLSWGYLYNKDIFEEQGLEVPTTLTEMKAVVEKLKSAGITPFELSYKEAWVPQLFLPLTVGALSQTDHKDFLDKMNQDQGSFSDMKAIFNIFDLVTANGTERALEVGPDDAAAAFATGKAAMWVQGPWYAETILKSNPDMNFGVAPMPIDDNPDNTKINLSTSTSLAVSSSSKNKEVALDFVNYVLDDKDSSGFYEALKFNPVAKIHDFKSFPWVDDALKYVNEGKAYQDPAVPQAVKDESGKVLQGYYSGQLNQQQVIDALDKAWKSYNKVNK
ncbi:ABC transporter substrate-binding protein [Paenibacillus tundrae]|uniref:Raffinose/stachyose/melibiose transport system substrate-binding protein n=1 Tax=Paenibacillus tundrae TaxID=528187 RepID=A0ABT9WHA2_9BACL|nr:extracellular solute-binding protein [Paenibacillus tundrae]MDQ0172578.1 raffinose/stachyose/melibiose transport system substrate-binding protein [Paenibacillus tundrae]